MFLQASGLSKRYGPFSALEQCSFETQQGEVLGLLGPNGAGKTTLLRLLLGFLKPSAGTATLDGFDCYDQAVEVHKRVSYLPGDPRLPRNLTGRQILKFFARLHPASSEKSALEMAQRLELDDACPVKHMSSGMRQKLALAIQLAPDVPLIVLDEPTSNLDPSVRSVVLQILREAKAAQKGVLFSSHVLSEVEEISDRVILLRQGQLVETLRMVDVRLQHRIRAKLTGPFTLPQNALAEHLHIEHDQEGCMTIQTARPLEPLLGWLASQPLEELRIEPLGLRAIYERHHTVGGS